MNRKAILISCFALVAVTAGVQAAGPAFSFTAQGGAIPQDQNGSIGISNYPLVMNPASSDINPAPPYPMPAIESIELVLTDLSHTQPDDLHIFLLSPFGERVEIMTEKGDGIPIVNLDLVFNDLGSVLPADGLQLPAGTYRTEDGEGGMSSFVGSSGGTNAWELLIIDDSAGDTGSLGSFTLRGTYVPEPASLALLAFGALAALRRRSRVAS